ncbi:hypothetical protein PR048_024488 [Dryococelus australis]|uniref:Uncharacterized protein n=1 Tax=Dryococelus australis TaxID=614101 RepID=A0ABQ9GNT5_9NEOP|nr:hypothetical protein PR048_024488 [Dryococelus australis]
MRAKRGSVGWCRLRGSGRVPRGGPPTSDIVRRDSHMRRREVSHTPFELGTLASNIPGDRHEMKSYDGTTMEYTDEGNRSTPGKLRWLSGQNHSPPTALNSSAHLPTRRIGFDSPRGGPRIRTWELCRMMPLDGGFPQRSPVSPALTLQRWSTAYSPLKIPILQHLAMWVGGGDEVAERLTCSPPTMTNRAQSPARSLPAGFLCDLPFPPPLHSGAAPFSYHLTPMHNRQLVLVVDVDGNQSNQVSESVLKCFRPQPDGFLLSRKSGVHTRGRVRGVVILLASHQGELGSIPSRATPGFSQVGIVTDDAAGRRFFLRDLPFLPPFRSGAAPFPPHSTLIGFQDLVVTSRSNLSIQVMLVVFRHMFLIYCGPIAKAT